MAGRPRLYDHAHHFTMTVEGGVYAALSGGMLHEYRKRHPEARTSDLIRSILDQAVARYRAGEAERTGAAERERNQRRQKLRRLAVTLVQASDDQIEAQAHKLAAALNGERPAA